MKWERNRLEARQIAVLHDHPEFTVTMYEQYYIRWIIKFSTSMVWGIIWKLLDF